MVKYLIKRSKNKNEMIMVFSPDVVSVNEVLKQFLENRTFNDNITIKMDLVAFIGDRPERFMKFNIKHIDSAIEKSFIEGEYDEESKQVTMNEYAKLPLALIDKIYPVAYRDQIINLKS